MKPAGAGRGHLLLLYLSSGLMLFIAAPPFGFGPVAFFSLIPMLYATRLSHSYRFAALGGLLAGAAGLIVTARLDSAQPNAGLGYELDSIAAVVIGGTSLSGGQGSVLDTVLGCLIIGVLNNGLFLLDVSPFWQQVVKGFVILAAVAVDKMSARET